MNISYVKIAWKFVTSGVGKVADYLFDVVNAALASIDPSRKETIAAVFNTAMKCKGVLDAIAWLVPTKWQRAYRHTLDALECVLVIIDDFTITPEELSAVKSKYEFAVKSWKEPDDPTCVTLEDVMVED